MEWIEKAKDIWWLLGILFVILVAIIKLAISISKSKERLNQVAKHDESITTLKTEMANIKEDIFDIKVGVDKQGSDTAAILSSLQSIMNALYDSNCNIGPARDKFNEYLANR